MKLSSQGRSIYGWMIRNADRFIDQRTGEVNATRMVEAWDNETQTGSVTLDSDHEAWDVAVKVADIIEHGAKPLRG